MSLSTLLWTLRPKVAERIQPLAEPWPAYALFFSLSDGTSRARVIHASGDDFDTVWSRLARQAQTLVMKEKLHVDRLRADWVTGAQRLDLNAFKKLLTSFKRNYFRCGLALDDELQVAFLEQELNANAMLYGGTAINHAVLNEKNFRHYAGRRFPGHEFDFRDDATLAILRTEAVFCSLEEGALPLYGTGRDAGRRVIETLDEPVVRGLIERGSSFLAGQVRSSGRFLYGWHPCFDRPIRTYNTLRHASTAYAMLEAWEITRDSHLLAAIKRALDVLVTEMIATVTLPDGEEAAFLVDLGDEIKLGGNAVCLLALSLYTELFDDPRYLQIMERLAIGICHMQDPDSGRFNHVLNHPDLSVKEAFRIIYYDGEAVFGLLRLYRVSKNPRWLETVERAFAHFIEQEHWKAHDHWLSYSVNELTRYRPEERYFRFGILNVAGHLDFVERRITTFPTLLELMMAAREMLERIAAQPALQHLLEEIDTEHFQRALDTRARYLMNGHFWPEYAMYFQNPRRIEGSFFIRHHAFRVRIDDVEHYLSGYAAYYRYLKRKGSTMTIAALPSDKKTAAQSATSDVLYARLANFTVDIEQLRQHFQQRVTQIEPIPYRDQRVDYLGWAVTSRDGSVEDGVRRIATNTTNRKRGTVATDICEGYLAEVMDSLSQYGLSPYRVRIMQLESEGVEMPFHTDARSETWRVHIPIMTNADSFFEWQAKDGRIERLHMPADGSAWLVRVDIPHRAVNNGEGGGRVHLLMGLNRLPERSMISETMKTVPDNSTSRILPAVL